MNSLRRSRDNSIIFGLLGGISEAISVDVVLVRILVVILFFTPIGPILALLYLVVSFVVPLESIEWRNEKRRYRIEKYKEASSDTDREKDLKNDKKEISKHRDPSELDEDEWSDF